MAWKRIKKNTWKKGTSVLIITGYGISYPTHWAVRVFHDAGWTSETQVVNKHFNTEKEALKFAKSYMKNN